MKKLSADIIISHVWDSPSVEGGLLPDLQSLARTVSPYPNRITALRNQSLECRPSYPGFSRAMLMCLTLPLSKWSSRASDTSPFEKGV